MSFRLRLAAEQQLLVYDCQEEIYAVPRDPDQLSEWYAIIKGPAQTAWQNGVFVLKITFPPDYPVDHPMIKFETPVYHPNVYTDGCICLDILKNNWNPVYTLPQVLMQIQSLLTDPNPDSPANQEAARLFKFDRHQYEMKVRQCVQDSLNLAPPIELTNALK